MGPRLETTLQFLVELMKDETDLWWIIGSTAALLAGIEEIEPEDVDIVAPRACLEQALHRLGLAAVPSKTNSRFRSHPYQRISVPNGTDIELMGDLCVYGTLGFEPLIISSRVEVLIPNGLVFIPSIAEQISILSRFGRQKDLQKAKLLITKL